MYGFWKRSVISSSMQKTEVEKSEELRFEEYWLRYVKIGRPKDENAAATPLLPNKWTGVIQTPAWDTDI